MASTRAPTRAAARAAARATARASRRTRSSTTVRRPRGTASRGTVPLLAAALLAGCGALGGGPDEAAPAQLEPAGWLDPGAPLAGGDFPSYAAAVRTLLDAHRLPLDPDDAEREAVLSSPREYPPATGCGGSRGIALLVHGLSDTAFAMRDVAEVLSGACFTARTVLLPGHGTRAGDLLVVDEQDWLDTVRELARQAALEQDTVLLGGVSLGATLSLAVALEANGDVDALLALSPAYGLSSWRLVRLAPWLRPFIPWLDKDRRDDWARYEAIPMQGIASTVGAIRHLRARLDDDAPVTIPWLLVQSRDDLIIDTELARTLFAERAVHPASRLIEIGRGEAAADLAPNTRWLRGDDPANRVTATTHIGVHIAPDNPHYGLGGDYRACGGNTGREAEAVRRCLDEAELWYTGSAEQAPADAASARSTFNPAFDELAGLIGEFVDSWAPAPQETHPTSGPHRATDAP